MNQAKRAVEDTQIQKGLIKGVNETVMQTIEGYILAEANGQITK